MSRDVAALVYSRQLGSMARKAVMAYFAERANDDGSGIWSAKQRIADEIECSKQTVITTIKGLIADGLLKEAGHRKTSNGYTVEYDIVLPAVKALPEARRPDQEVKNKTGTDLDGSSDLTSRGQAPLPKPSCNRPSSQKTSSSSKVRATAKTPVPTDFVPMMSGKTASIVDGWPPGRLDDELEAFADWHAKEGTQSADWQASWRTWVRNSKRWEKSNDQGSHSRRSSAASDDPRGKTVAAFDRLLAPVERG